MAITFELNEGWVSITGEEQNGEGMESERTGLEQLGSAGGNFLLDDGG
jgi:hypothetical protein